MPSNNYGNGLQLDEIPSDLIDLKELEQQMLSPNLLFMKVTRLPTSLMASLAGRVIRVPLEKEDIRNTIQSLPRTLDDSELLFVKLKRRKRYKGSYKEAWIRPNKIRKALEFYKRMKHPAFENISINDNFDADSREQDRETWDLLTGKDAEDNTADASSVEDRNEDSTNEASSDEDETDQLEAVQKFQCTDSTDTCMVREELEMDVVTNDTPGQQNNAHIIAPGEEKIPTN